MAKQVNFYQMVMGQVVTGREVVGTKCQLKTADNAEYQVTKVNVTDGYIEITEILPEDVADAAVAKVVKITEKNAIVVRYVMNPNPKPTPEAALKEENGKKYLVIGDNKVFLGKITAEKVVAGFTGEVILGVKNDKDEKFMNLLRYDVQFDKFDAETFATVSKAAEVVVIDGKTYIIDNIIEDVPQFDADGKPVLDANNNQVIKRRVVDVALYEYRGKGYLRRLVTENGCNDDEYDEDDYYDSIIFEVPIKSMRLIEQGQRKDIAIVTTDEVDSDGYLAESKQATITLLRAGDYAKVGTFYVNDPDAKIYLGGSFSKRPVVTVKDADQILIRDDHGLKVVDDIAVVAAMEGYNYFCATEVKKDEDDNNVVIFTYANVAMEVKSFKMTNTDRGLLFDII